MVSNIVATRVGPAGVGIWSSVDLLVCRDRGLFRLRLLSGLARSLAVVGGAAVWSQLTLQRCLHSTAVRLADKLAGVDRCSARCSDTDLGHGDSVAACTVGGVGQRAVLSLGQLCYRTASFHHLAQLVAAYNAVMHGVGFAIVNT